MVSLLSLPTEVRLQIYAFLLDSHAPSTADQMPLINPNQPTPEAREIYKSLLLSCRTIHHEAAPAFYSRCTFYANRPYDFANTFLRRLTLQDLTMDKLTALRHLELKVHGSRPFNEWRHDMAYTKGERKYWMDLVRVFDTYRELGRCLDSLVLTLTRERSDVAFTFHSQPLILTRVTNAFNSEREAERMLEAAQLLHERHLPHLALSRDVRDNVSQDLDPVSGTYMRWILQRIYTVRLLR